MIFKFIGISFAAPRIISIRESSREDHNLILLEHFWFSNQIIDVHNVRHSSRQVKSEFHFFFTVESVARENYYFWFLVFHNLSILLFYRIVEYPLLHTFRKSMINRM